MDIVLDFVIVGVLLAFVALILLTGNFTGYSVAVPYVTLSLPVLAVSVLSLSLGLLRFKKLFLSKENLSGLVLKSQSKENIKKLLEKSSSKNAVSAVIDALFKGLVDENHNLTYMVNDVFDVLANKIRMENNHFVLMDIINSLGKCNSLIENSKAPAEIKSYFNALYYLSQQCYLNRFVKKI